MNKTLSQLFKDQGKTLTSWNSPERQQLASQASIQGYTGSANQNAQLTNFLSGQQGSTQPQGLTSVSAVGGGTYNVPPQTTQPGAVSGTTGATTGTPTIGSLAGLTGEYEGILGREQSTSSAANEKYTESDAVRQLRSNIESQLSAYRQQRESKRGEISKEFENRKNIARAAQIRSGVVGSGVDAGQNSEIAGDEARAQQLADEAMNLQIAQAQQPLYEGVQSDLTRYDSQIEAKRKELSEITKEKKTAREKTLEAIGNYLVEKGVSAKDIDPSEIARLQAKGNFSVEEIATALSGSRQKKDLADLTKRQLEQKVAGEGAFNLSEGQTRYAFDPKTGGFSAVASKAKTYAPSRASSGGGTTSGGYSAGSQPVLKETGAEKNALGFYVRAKDASQSILPIEKKIAEYGLLGQAGLEYLPNPLQGEDNQLYRQLQRQFTEARLRKESGAAIPQSEFESDAKTYFAQPGDAPATIQRKEAARQSVLQSLEIGAGNAFKNFTGAQGQAAPTANIMVAPDGTEIEIID